MDTSLFSKYTAQIAVAGDKLSLPEELVHGAVAVLADAGISIWNSLTPEKLNVEIEDLLSRIDSNALQVYNEHPDLIHSVSFIAGSALPIGLAIKGMTALRSGSKAVNWFTEAGRVSRLQEVERAFANGGAGINEALNIAQRNYYLANAANAVIDTTAAELALVATMNAHPYMEDYKKDFAYNFLHNLVVGSAISGTIGHIIARGEISKAKMGVEKELTSALKNLTKTPEVSVNIGAQIQSRQQNIDNIQAYLEKADNLSNFTIESLKLIQQSEKAAIVDLIDKATVGKLAEASREFKNELAERIGRNIEFAPVSQLDFYSPKIGKKLKNPKPNQLKKYFTFATREDGELVKHDAVYFPTVESFVSKSEADHYGSIADLGKTIKEVEKSVDSSIGFKPREDAAILHSILPTAEVDEDYVKAFLRFHKMTEKDFAKASLVAAPDDLATLKAISLKAKELGALDKEVTLTSLQPNYSFIKQTRLEKAGITPTLLDKLTELSSPKKFKQFSITASSKNISKETKDILSRLSTDSDVLTYLRKGALFLRDEVRFTGEAETYAMEASRIVAELMHHPKTLALKNELSRIADAEGNVYLYRSDNATKTWGHKGLESFTFSSNGKNTLYKVHLDDIVGALNDEIFVLNPTREAIPIRESISFPSFKEFVTQDTFKLKASELDTYIEQLTKKHVHELAQDGHSAYTISLRTGTPIKTVEEILTGNISLGGAGLYKYTSIPDIEMALHESNRGIAMATNMNMHSPINVRAALNSRTSETISQKILEAYTLSSSSKLAHDIIGKGLFNEEARAQTHFLSKEIDNLLFTGLGSTFFRSADSAVRRLGAAGIYLTSAGKRLIDVKNRAREELTKPISEALSAVVKGGDAHIIEFNTAIEVLNAQSGMRFYKARKFWKMEAGNLPIHEILNMSDEDFLAWAKSSPESDPTRVMARAIDFKGKEFSIATPTVDAALKILQDAGRDMYETADIFYKTTGRGKMPDIGFWIPATNPTGKQIAYVFNTVTGETTLILGKTPAELNSRIAEFEASLGADKGFYKIVTKGRDQQEFNKIAGRHDPMFMAIADTSKLHGGASARAVVTTNTELMAEIVQGYEYQIGKNIDRLAEILYAPILDKFDKLSLIATHGYSPAALNKLQRGVARPVDPGKVFKNLLMGRSNLEEYEAWTNFQTGLQAIADRALNTISDILLPILGKTHRTPEDWDKVVAQMEKEGIVNPFQTVETFINSNGAMDVRSVPNIEAGRVTYLREGKVISGSPSARLVALSNGLIATVVLRAAELMQPLINIVSLPILTSGAVNRELAASFMGSALNRKAKFSTISLMYDAIRLANHPTESKIWDKLAEEAGLFKNDWRVVNGLLKQVKSLEPGIMSRAEELLDSTLVEWLSKPADKSETFVRRMSFFTGVVLAKKAYPGLSKAGVMTFARNFMNEAVGNYTTAQRPVMFQGAVGVALGLFQTYMLTMAQHIYSQIETRNWKALGKMLLTQQTIFGASSLPGFHPVSEMIATHFSDNHVDLETGLFRALDDEVAEIILYGLPSQFIGITTRGDIQPKIPTGFQEVAMVSFAKQAYKAIERVIEAAWTADKNTGVALLEALSLQSMSRPIARWSELLMGKSITASGEVISHNDEVYTITGIISRILATRPLEEIKAREAHHLNSLYGAIDRDRRKEVIFRLRSYIEEGTLDEEKLAELSYEYLRTGTPTGWRSIVNEAIFMANQPGSSMLRDRLKPDSPLQLMLNDLD